MKPISARKYIQYLFRAACLLEVVVALYISYFIVELKFPVSLIILMVVNAAAIGVSLAGNNILEDFIQDEDLKVK